MEISVFIREYAPLAGEAGRAFRIDPVVILAQAAIETGWGESTLCREYHNFFGITAYGLPNVWWTGRWTELSPRSLRFRIYPAGGRSCRPARYVSGSTRTISARSWITAACFARPIPGRPT